MGWGWNRLLKRYFPSQYLLPIALLLTFSLGGLFILLFQLTRLQDDSERVRETQIVASAIESERVYVVDELRDYAFWDTA